MPDDDIVEIDPEDEQDVDVDSLDEEALDEDVLEVDLDEEDFGEDGFGVAADAGVEVDVDAAVDLEEGDDEPLPRGRKKADDDDSDDDDTADPDDVEADLQSILQDRIAANDDDDDDEDEVEVETRPGPENADGVAPKRSNEYMCNCCFLLVSPAQFGKPSQPRCPVGEDPCPAIAALFEAGDSAPSTKSTAKAAKVDKKTR